MILLISGSRNITDYQILRRAIFEFLKTIYLDEIPLPLNKHIDKIVHGNAKGIDTLADRFADDQKISKVIFPANWAKYNKGAGHIRNSDMIDYLWAMKMAYDSYVKCLAIPQSTKSGTYNCINQCKKLDIPVYIYDKCMS